MAVVIIVAAVATRLNRPEPATAPPTSQTPAAIEFLAAELVTAGPQTLVRELPVTGTLQAVERTTLKTKVAGTLLELKVRPGTTVRQGDLLGRIDATTYAARLRAQEADTASARASLALADKQRDNNRTLLERGFISKNAFDNNQKESDVARAVLDASRAQLDLARQALRDTQLRAPISGVVAERFAQEGETLPIDAQVLSIVDLSRLEVEVAVPASEIGAVRIGQPFSLQAEGLPQPLEGKAVRIAPTTTEGTRSITVYVEVDNRAATAGETDRAARVGMFVTGKLAAESAQVGNAVPLSAVREERGQQVVYVIENGLVARHLVSTGASGAVQGEPWMEITEGLNPGVQVVRTPGGPLTPGAPARVQAAPPQAPQPAPGPAPATGNGA